MDIKKENLLENYLEINHRKLARFICYDTLADRVAEKITEKLKKELK